MCTGMYVYKSVCVEVFCHYHRCDDNSPIGAKMLYASTKDNIKKSFSGLSLEFQANDKGDFDYTVMADEVERKV